MPPVAVEFCLPQNGQVCTTSQCPGHPLSYWTHRPVNPWQTPYRLSSRPDQLTRLQTTSTWNEFQQAECSNREVYVERTNIYRHQFVQRWEWNLCDQRYRGADQWMHHSVLISSVRTCTEHLEAPLSQNIVIKAYQMASATLRNSCYFNVLKLVIIDWRVNYPG